MKRYFKFMMSIFFGIIISVMLFALLKCTDPDVVGCTEIDQLPNIDPDYTGIAIPPNIAPLNFTINEEGTEYCIDIYTNNGNSDRVKIKTKKNKVSIPIKKWKNLLSENRGKELYIDVYLKNQDNEWEKFRTIENKIAEEEIDSHVAYRLINPGYVLWWEMGIYQRNIERFEESVIFSNRVANHNCMNCHSFCNNDPETMMVHMRAKYSGTMLVKNGDMNKIDTGTKYTMSAGAYPAWHPDGNHIAFSVNKIGQSFHAQKDKSIHVSNWPKSEKLKKFEEFDLFVDLLAKIRQEKTKKKKSMNAEIILSINKKDYELLKNMIEDLKDVANAVEIKQGKFKVEFVEK